MKGSHALLPGLGSSLSLLISISGLAEIIGINYHAQPVDFSFKMKKTNHAYNHRATNSIR
jgi:hypothetical protein